MKQQNSSKPSKLASAEGLLHNANKQRKCLSFSNSRGRKPQSQPPVELFWHREGKTTPELKRVFTMLLRGRK